LPHKQGEYEILAKESGVLDVVVVVGRGKDRAAALLDELPSAPPPCRLLAIMPMFICTPIALRS
jgi:hypothetical protein